MQAGPAICAKRGLPNASRLVVFLTDSCRPRIVDDALIADLVARLMSERGAPAGLRVDMMNTHRLTVWQRITGSVAHVQPGENLEMALRLRGRIAIPLTDEIEFEDA